MLIGKLVGEFTVYIVIFLELALTNGSSVIDDALESQ